MVEQDGKCSINVTFDQHEALTNMKRGRDTFYDVVDRLIVNDARIADLERQFDILDAAFILLHNTVKELRTEMMKWES